MVGVKDEMNVRLGAVLDRDNDQWRVRGIGCPDIAHKKQTLANLRCAPLTRRHSAALAR
jgi:hypothetical protein